MWLPPLIVYSTVLVLGAANPVVTVIAGSTGAALVTATGAWLLARRRESGMVRPSNAAELWTAYDRLFGRAEADNQALRAEVKDLEEQNRVLRERVAVLESEVRQLRASHG